MLVSHSPPVFSHHTAPISFPLTCRSHNMLPPKRPCLVTTKPTTTKKRVVFADDRGLSLTHVRIMSEPSNVPPLWSFRFLAEVTHGVTAAPEAPHTHHQPWKITFAQPASDYVDFRKRLDNNKVSLENVMLKEGEETIVGTVKVANLAYNKTVFVRITFNNWKTFEDAFCNFVQTATTSSATAYVLYDTFSFKIALPPRGRRIDFCVGYRCEGQEYWDSNNGQNYVILKEGGTLHKSYSADDVYKPRVHPTWGEAVQAKLEAWSEFASWNHLETTTPYW